MSSKNKNQSASQKHIKKLLDEHENGLTSAGIAKLLRMERHIVRRLLNQVERHGDAIKVGSRYFSSQGKSNRVKGLFKRKFSGAGTLYVDETHQEVMINRRQGYFLVDGDRVEAISSIDNNGMVKGHITSIVNRRSEPITGYFKMSQYGASIFPLDQRISPPINLIGSYDKKLSGKVVVVQLQPSLGLRSIPQAIITNVLGQRNDFGVQTAIITRKFNIRDEMPERVNKDAKLLIEQASQRDMRSRRDFRDMLTITIDPEHARDFDDALSINHSVDGIQLVVHIADVSHFVTVQSLVDQEAFLRGTSVYLPERAIHMLPEDLATTICSLRPMEDRLAVSVLINFDLEGHMQDGEICESIICSDARMTYKQFLTASEDTQPVNTEFPMHVQKMCSQLSDLCRKLVRRRIERGVLDLDMPETFFELDQKGKVCGIHKKTRSIAEQTVEEFMIAANVFVARFLDEKKVPYLKRFHDTPDPSEIHELRQSLAQLGLNPPNNPLDPDAVRELLASIENSAVRSVASHRILRSMRRAVYSASKSGHFGLALEHYTQFTSPIRRYPDLEVHRSVKAALKISGYPTSTIAALEEKARILSDYERRAQEAEWDAVKIEKIRFMQSKVGNSFIGTITHVIEFGAYVELDEPFVEGFIPVSQLDDYFRYIESESSLVNDNRSVVLKPGQTVNVQLESADIDRGNLDFTIVKSG